MTVNTQRNRKGSIFVCRARQNDVFFTELAAEFCPYYFVTAHSFSKIWVLFYMMSRILFFCDIKFSFSEKATKMFAICLLVLIFKRQNHKADCSNFCGLLRKAEFYIDRDLISTFGLLEQGCCK